LADLQEEEEEIYIELQRLEALYHRVIEEEDFFALELKSYHTTECGDIPLHYHLAKEDTQCINAAPSQGPYENVWVSYVGEVGISATDETEESSACHDPMSSLHHTLSDSWQGQQNEDLISVADDTISTAQYHHDDENQAKAPDYFSAHSSPGSCIDVLSEKLWEENAGSEHPESSFSSFSYGDVVQVPSTETLWHECYQEDSSADSLNSF
jgi:hypothetical protein